MALAAATLPLAVLWAALMITGRWRRAQAEETARQRLARLEQALAALDRVVAISCEIDDRYANGAAATAQEQHTLLDLRKALAEHMAVARAAIDAFGDLRDIRLPGEAFFAATRPVYVSPPMAGDSERSLEQLRALCNRMRGDLLEVTAAVRDRLDRRVWRTAFREHR